MDEEMINSKIQEVMDRGNYLRGLLILIRMDKNVWDHENYLFMEEAESLGFDKEFSSNALRGLVTNKYLETAPPVFFDKKYAARLIIRGLHMINQNLKIHPEEIKYLVNIARMNNLSDKWEHRIIPQVMVN